MVALADAVKLWKNRCIPYEDRSSKTPDHIKKLREWLDVWENACGVSFVPRTSEANYVIIWPGFGQTAIGMQGGAQDVYIPDPNANGVYYDQERRTRALHELGHTLGLINEQCRSDRDAFVDIEWGHIVNGTSNDEYQVCKSQNLTDYDRASIMHNPSPSQGWGGRPVNQEVSTMRWKKDPAFVFRLGELSEMDKKAVKDKYATEPVPMGSEIKNSTWQNPYAVQFPFSIGQRRFLYGHNIEKEEWYISEFKNDGSISKLKGGTWNNAYRVSIPFTVCGGRVFFYAQNTGSNYWFIQELLPNGDMGRETDENHWDDTYESVCTFMVEDQTYLYGQNRSSKYWFIQQLLVGGKMGRETSNGFATRAFDVKFPFSANFTQYLYRYCIKDNVWEIRELESGGKLSAKCSIGSLDETYDVQFRYSVGNNHYLYGQSSTSRNWFIRRFDQALLGNILQRGSWTQYYPVQFPITMPNGSQRFYGNNASGNKWFIQELLDIPKGNQWSLIDK
ncbi:hypothetical protein FGADI_12870 [Fusarium gaditjirri]|uniref:Metalloendopeptidase n=1 Tax=Fusarium gaditjirri TaxID=282569 RepID=A0A8H4SRG0_9HYPO|nr:hypothetical protein FGADI_12870 [Fusarium gaditjirri]